MPHVIVALFKAEEEAREAMETLFHIGVGDRDLACLVAGPAVATWGSRALLAVKVDPSRAERELVEEVLLDHDGRFVPRCRESPEAMKLIQQLPGAHDAFKPPEAVLPPVLVAAMEENRAEQPDVEPRTSRLPFGYRISG
ncbi:MAG TPA: hypothetical protein VGO93_05125 [Candidatus Xenobia bacterium]|jgi:hypothetical protein